MLPPDGTRADLPGLLYEGTTDNGSWNDFLRGVANALGGESAAFMFGRPDLGLHLVSHSWGQDPEGIRLYAEHYGKLDVWAEKGQRIPTAEWLGPSEALCSFEELARTEFFNDFLLRFEAVHGLFGAGQCIYKPKRIRQPKTRTFRRRRCRPDKVSHATYKTRFPDPL